MILRCITSNIETKQQKDIKQLFLNPRLACKWAKVHVFNITIVFNLLIVHRLPYFRLTQQIVFGGNPLFLSTVI